MTGFAHAVFGMLAGILVAACQQYGVQLDFSGLGRSVLAERISVIYTGVDDEYGSNEMTRWLATQCEMTSVDSAQTCATRIGMACDAPIAQDLTCRYRGVVRKREIWFTIRPSLHDREGPWLVVQVDVTLQYEDGHGAAMTYRKTVIETGASDG